MPGQDDSFDEGSWDNSGSATLPDTYPAMGPSNQNAKDWDMCRLANCSAKRLRTIAKAYEGVSWRLKKTEMFIAICDAMNEEQECLTCEGGNCSPFTHWFAGVEPPPLGWVRGPDGLYVPPQSASNSVQETPPPGPSNNVRAMLPPGSSTPAQSPRTMQSLAGLDLATSNFRPRNPASHLLRPSFSPDIRPEHPTPYIAGVVNVRPPVPDVAALVKAGGAATRTRSSFNGSAQQDVIQNKTSRTTTSPTRPSPGVTEESVDQDLENEIEQRQLENQRRREAEKQKVAKENSAAAASLEAEEQRRIRIEKRRQSFLAAEEAEERAHQLELDQLRAARPAPPAPGPPDLPRQVLPPPAQQCSYGIPQRVQNPGFLPAANPVPPRPVPSYLQTQPGRERAVSFSESSFVRVDPQQVPPNPQSGMIDLASVEALLESKLKVLGQSLTSFGIGNQHGGSASNVSADSGKTLSHNVTNPYMASRLGVFARPMFEITGDITNSNLSKLTKIMVAGHDRVGPGLCLRQEQWPHELLQAGVPGHMTVEHDNLSFHQFINGCFSKALTEIPMERLDLTMANKLSFFQFLSNMSFSYDHKEVLLAYKEVHNAWQMREFEWTDDWKSIEERLKNIRCRFQQVPQKHTASQGIAFPGFERNGGGHGSGGGGAGKGGNPANQHNEGSDINGVPRSFCKENNICMKFNGKRKSCLKQGSHKNDADASQTLLHICAGCFKKDGSKLPHRCFDCEKGPFGSLFRGR